MLNSQIIIGQTQFNLQTLLINIQMHRDRVPYMHQWEIHDASELPVPEQNRKCTDVCCLLIGIVFGLTLFIIACIDFNSATLLRINYPADSNGVVCMLDTSTATHYYPFLYFNNISDPTVGRYCVTGCPQPGVITHCYGNCTISYYPNYPSSTRLGSFCLPTDPTLKDALLNKGGIKTRFNNLHALNYLFMGLWIAFVLSLIWLALVQCLPKWIYWIGLVLALFLLIVVMFVFFIGSGNTLKQGQGWAIILGIVSLVLAVIIVIYSWLHRKQIYITGCFLQIAGNYLRQHLSTLIWVPIFVALTFLFGFILSFEYLGFTSAGTPTFNPSNVYYSLYNNWFAVLVLAIQALWGLSFFRDMYYYIISGLACEWYFQREPSFYTPLPRLFKKNIGSVASGSFISSIFFIPSMLISLLFPDSNCCCCNFFDLAREDAYSWIYLTGNSFCPSSRQTQYICRRSSICRQNQSVVDIFTFIARVVLSLSAMMIIYWIGASNLVQGRIPPYLLVGEFFICLYITCFCSDLHTNIAEAFLVCFLAEYELQEGWSYDKMKYCPDRLRQLVNDVDGRAEYGMPFQKQ